MKTILVVDDVQERITDIQQEVIFSFPPKHFEVKGANSVQEAISAFESGQFFDLVILDLRLPEDPNVPEEEREVGGLYLLRRFAKLHPTTMFVLSSGSHGRDDRPQIQLPKDFPEENFRCIPKTTGRGELLQILRQLSPKKKVAAASAPATTTAAAVLA